MNPTTRSALALLLASVLPACRPAAAPTAEGPRIVVALVIDQFAAWQADERVPALRNGGGFGRLVREGTWYHAMQYEHGATDTALGHASLFTGALPGEVGVDRNDSCSGNERRPSFIDPSVRLVTLTAERASERPAASLTLVPEAERRTLADELRSSPAFGDRGGILAVSLKDRGSLFACGSRPDFCAWFDRQAEAFATSDRFLERPSAGALWSAVRADPATPRPILPRIVSPLPATLRAADAPHDYDEPGAVGPGLAKVDPAFLMFRARIAADHATLELARTAVSHFADAHQNAPIFLSISLSGHDYVGHSYGASSPASEAHFRALDQELAQLFGWLDARFPRRWSVVLASDHGVKRGQPLRLRSEDLLAALRSTGAPIECFADPYLHWKAGVTAQERTRFVDGWRKRMPPLVGGFVDRDEECKGAQGSVAFVCNSIIPGKSLARDTYVWAAPEAMFDPEMLLGQGSSHGSPTADERTVPLFVLDAGSPKAADVTPPVPFTMFRRALLDRLGAGSRK